jgi:hypothetical protein
MENIFHFSPHWSATPATLMWLSPCFTRIIFRFLAWKIHRAEWKTITLAKAAFFANYGNSAGLAKKL